MELPPNFVDPFPERGPFRDVAVELPQPYDCLGCLFTDGHTEPATWTGKIWWTYHGEVHPIAWRPSQHGHSIGR